MLLYSSKKLEVYQHFKVKNKLQVKKLTKLVSHTQKTKEKKKTKPRKNQIK